MKRLGLFLILVSGASAQCYPPELGWGSWLSIDSGSGEIIGESQTVVTYDTSCITQADIVQDTAGVVGNLNGTYVTSATDNCGPGCATVYTFGQVARLGETDTETGAHSGTLSYADAYFFDYETSGVSENIPSAPYMYFTGINAVNPHNVQWRYAISGYEPAGLNFTYGNIFLISTPPGSSGAFYADQMAYPQGGYNDVYLTSSMFGIAIGGAVCPVLREDNYQEPNNNAYSVRDGTIDPLGFPGFITARHVVSDAFSFFSYSYCNVTVDYGSLVNTLGTTPYSASIGSTGSVDTRNNAASANAQIYFIGETNNHGGIVDPLGPVTGLTDPQQGDFFQSLDLNYAVGTWWFPVSYPDIYVCNTALTVSGYQNNNLDLYATSPLGCLNTPVPF